MKKFIILILLFATPVLAGDWVDLQSNTTFTDAQLTRRYDRQIRSKFPLTVERIILRRAMGVMKGKYIPTEVDIATEAAYEAHTKAIRGDYDQAVTDNVLLLATVAYEQAQKRLAQYRLSEGVAPVAEIPEERDPDTGEILQEYIPATIGIDPLPATIEQNTYDDEGDLIDTGTVPNPVVTKDESERASAHGIIDSADEATLILVGVRE